MLAISFYLSGLSVVLSLFILAVSIRAYRRSGIRLFAYLMIVFIVILFDSILYTLSGFIFVQFPLSFDDIFLISDVVILLLFYFGAVRGS